MNNTNMPMFGEKDFDKLYGYSCPVEQTEKYKSSRERAIKLMDKYGLDEKDFWIKKELFYKETIIYQNLMPTYQGCRKIDRQLPENERFNPELIEQGIGADGGILFIYREKKPGGIFATGEASRFNLGNRPYPANIAKSRLFCQVIALKIGFDDDLDTEIDGDMSRQVTSMAQGAPLAQPPVQTTAPVNAERIESLKKRAAATGTSLETICNYYKVFSIEELSENDLANCEEVLERKERKASAPQSAKKAAAPQPNRQAQKQPVNQNPDQQAASPIAQFIVNRANGETTEPSVQDVQTPAKPNEPTPAATPAKPAVGETIYHCIDTAPADFQAMNGKTLDEIGYKMLKALYSRKNAAGKQYVSDDLNEAIAQYLKLSA